MNHPLITGKDFIVFGLQPWDFEMGSNCKNIALELAKHNRVLYVNRPIERSSLYKFRKDPKIQNRLNSLKKGVDVLKMEEDNIWVFNPRVVLESINWLPPGRIYHSISRSNARKFSSQIKWATERLQMSDPILFVDNDFLKGLYLNDYLKSRLYVYYIRDFLLSQQYFIKHGTEMEPELIRKADIVVTNSSYLAEYASKYNSRSFDIGQGCELEAYIKGGHRLPEDMKSISKPIVGYCGALLETRLDLTLLEIIAQKRKDWNIVLVG
ncbi:MAG TPA: glycosyltransferase family 1 protein, partial [Flavisolibacter sp.]|nr:glycosyltransferase family 1 protein [Flavisolibacter sp.]